MNVEYRCRFEIKDPDTDEVVRRCGTRMFLPPGGRSPHKCRHHPDAGMEQTEETHAPDFLFVDEDGHTKSKDIIAKDSEGNMTRRMRPEPIIDRNAPPDPILVMEQTQWREAYVAELGKMPDLRWGVPRIQEEILKHRQEVNAMREHEGQTDGAESNETDGEFPPGPDDPVNHVDEGDPELITTSPGEIVDAIPPATEGDNDGE